MADEQEMEDLVRRKMARYKKLSNDLATEEPIWRDIRNFLKPRSARFQMEDLRGRRMDYNIINTSPLYAVRTLPAGLQAGASSPVRPWFRLGTPDPEMIEFKPVKEWLFDVERKMRFVFSNSNLYDNLKSNYGTLGLYGTSTLLIDEDPDEVIRASNFQLGTWRIALSPQGRPNTLYRDAEMNVARVVGRFGYEKVSQRVREMYDRGDYEELVNLVHIIEPNDDFNPKSALSSKKRFSSLWLDPLDNNERGKVYQKLGYSEQACFSPRWDVIGENSYGDGCGVIALGDAKQLQHMEKRKLQAIDKNANPTMLADASMRNQRVSNLPGDTVYVNNLINGKPGYQPAYMPNPYINELREEGAAVSNRIDEAFYKNLFLMVTEIADQPNITATQINTMREEKLLMLGPVLERMNNELFSPIIDRTFAIMYRRGMLAPPPKELQGMPLKVEYVSVLAQAQKALGIGNIERFTGYVGSLVEIFPEAAFKLNVFNAIDAYADGVAVPPSLLNTDDEANEQKEAMQAAQQQAVQAEQMAQMASTAKDASQISLDTENPVGRALDIAGGPQ